MDEQQATGFLVRAALAWFPSTWVRQLNMLAELRDGCQGLDWPGYDDIPF